MPPHGGGELRRRELEPQEEQQEQDAQLPRRSDELRRRAHLVHPALAEHEPDEEEQRHRRETEAGGDVGQEREQEQDEAQLEQEGLHVLGAPIPR